MRLLVLTVLVLAWPVGLWLRRTGRWHDLRDRTQAQWMRTWRWVFWSPRRLLAVVAVLGVLGWGWAAAQHTATTAPAAASDQDRGLPAGWRQWTPVTAAPGPGAGVAPATATSTGSAPSSGPATSGASSSTPTSADAPRVRVMSASTAFVRAWTLRAPAARRAAALRPVASTRLVNVLAPVDVRELVAPTGAPVIRDLDRDGAVVVVPLAGGARAVLHLSPGPTSTGWVVDAVSQEGPA